MRPLTMQSCYTTYPVRPSKGGLPSFVNLMAAMALITAGVVAGPVHGDTFDQQSMPLFDGETLAGWEGKTYWFRVEDSCIVAGRLDEPIPHNQFLCTTEKFADFELRLEAKLVGKGNNAGVQFRSRRVSGSSEVAGYQADIGSAWDRPVWGALYDESRRRKMLAEAEPDKLRDLVRPGDWNQLRIRCVGNHIQIFLNGEQTVDYQETEASILRLGVIGLQVHSGPPMEAWYRNIRIRSLSPPAAADREVDGEPEVEGHPQAGKSKSD